MSKRVQWRHMIGIDDHYELEIRPDVFVAIHREHGEARWHGALFEAGGEELPFLTFQITAKSVRCAKREAIERTAKALFKLVEALDRAKAA